MGPLARLDAVLLRNFLAELQLWEQIEKDERKKAPRPAQKRLRLSDATIEAAQQALAGSPDGLLMVQDELSGFFGSMDKYGGHRGAPKDRAFWLQSFNGGHLCAESRRPWRGPDPESVGQPAWRHPARRDPATGR